MNTTPLTSLVRQFRLAILMQANAASANAATSVQRGIARRVNALESEVTERVANLRTARAYLAVPELMTLRMRLHLESFDDASDVKVDRSAPLDSDVIVALGLDGEPSDDEYTALMREIPARFSNL